MSRNIEILDQRLIGYHKKQVDQFIDEIHIAHQKTINFLEENIANHPAEKERLLKKIAMLKNSDQNKEDETELLEFALKRVSKTIALINKIADEDIEKIIEHAKSKIVLHEKKAKDLVDQMEEQRAEIDHLLIKVQLLFSGKQIVENIKDKKEIKEIKESNEVKEKKEDTKSNKSHITTSKFPNTNLNLEKLLTINDYQKNTILSTKDISEDVPQDQKKAQEREAEKITADGFSLANLNDFSETKTQSDLSKKYEKNMKKESTEKESAEKQSKEDSFWEDWEDPSLKQIGVPKLNNVVQLPGDIFNRERLKESALKEILSQGVKDIKENIITEEPIKEELINEELAWEQNINNKKTDKNNFPFSDITEKEEIKEELTEESIEKHNENQTSQQVSEESIKGSKSVTQEIEKIRQKYMVGKIAGADLSDLKGNLIVSKNSVISAEVVKKAEEEGKLVELILNMSFLGIEE